MNLRKNVLPRNIPDALVTICTFIIIPLIYYFEMFVVFPQYFTPWKGWYLFHFIGGTFVLFNIYTNWIAIMVCDTSIKGRILPANLGPNWRFCATCECTAPPRSFHCDTCDTCVLKRDHHCMFTSCCIGYHNQRYFSMFVLYTFIATTYTTFYNIFYIREFMVFDSFLSIIKLLFPLATLFINYNTTQLCIFLVFIILVVSIFTAILIAFHVDLIKRGVVSHERHQKCSEYDLGVKQNFVEVFGEKWHLMWISPFIKSPLPRDGVNWDTKQSLKAK